MKPGHPREPTDVLSALERLVAKDVLTTEQARMAARLITGDESLEFPRPPAPPQEPAAEAPAPAEQDGGGASTEGSESL